MCRVRLDLADGTTGGYNKDKELLVSKGGKDWNTYSDFGMMRSISKERRNVPLSGSDGLFAIAIGMAGKKPALGKRGMADHMHAPNQSV
jgi:hypothetical protein